MIYLLLCTIAFAVLSIHRKHRFEWSVLTVVTFVNFILTCVYGNEDRMIYILVPAVTSMGAVALCTSASFLGFYQAAILFLTLFAYVALEFDITQGVHVLIYNNYEAVIYGLVGCQFITIFPTLWLTYNDIVKYRFGRNGNIQRSKRT